MNVSSSNIQLQYGGKCYSNLGTFCVNQTSRTLGDISLEGANFLELFSKIEKYHVRKIF